MYELILIFTYYLYKKKGAILIYSIIHQNI